jgi:predicted dinucleotide-binding enzyme
MKVGIIGAGVVGESFGKALIRAGHEVMFSSRDPRGEKAQKVKAETGAAVGTVSEVLNYSDTIAIAMPPDIVLQVATKYADQLKSKVLIDMNNRFTPSASGLSMAQDLTNISDARVIKAFNTIGAEHYLDTIFSGQAASMFIAGDDAEAKKIVGQLASDIGFDVVDCGGLNAAGLVEKLAELWVHLLRSGMGRNMAFKLLKK